MFNELIVGFCFFHLTMFTDAVSDQQTQVIYGWSYVAWLNVLSTVNILIVIWETAKILFLLTLRTFRKVKMCCNKKNKVDVEVGVE